MSEEIKPFKIDVSDADLDDLKRRLRATRWPEKETVDDWSQGVPLAYVKDVCGYWAEKYDRRKTEARLNALPQFRTELDEVNIHFLHVRSPHQDAVPLVMTHGWPGSIVEFLKVLPRLTDPTKHGGEAGGVRFAGSGADDGHGGATGHGADDAGGFDAVHEGHLSIHENEVVIALAKMRDGFDAVGGDVDQATEAFQNDAGRFGVDFFIFG